MDLRNNSAKLLTFGEAAKLLSISLRQFRRLVDGGKLPVVRISDRAPRIRPGDLEKLISSSIEAS